jgi:hypothetical protein
MADNPVETLRSSSNPNELKVAAQTLAASDKPDDHKALQPFLADAGFLGRLDSEDDYRKRWRTRLRIGRVLDVLSRNEAPSAREVVVALAEARAFLAHESRVELLIGASARVRPAPPGLVRFWQECLHPEEGSPTLTVEALVQNGSPPALELLERTMARPGHDEEDKIGWMRRSILTRRNDLGLLQCCRRMLAGSLPEDLRPSLVEVLFDYRPAEWFRPSSSAAPPPREAMSDKAKAELRAIGELALEKVRLTREQEAAVKRTLTGLKRKGQEKEPPAEPQ